MRIIAWCLISLIIWHGGGSLSLAEPFRRIGQGVRNLGMGNTGVALSYDENALYYNPAGLIGVDAFFVSFSILGEVSDDVLSVAGQDNASTETVGDVIALGLGKQIHTRFMQRLDILAPFKEISLGASFIGGQVTPESDFPGEVELDFRIQNPVLPQMTIAVRADQVQTYGVAVPLWGGHWVLGAGARVVKRHADVPYRIITLGTLVTASTDTSDLLDNLGVTTPASANGFDLGIIRRFESGSSLRMSWGLVAQNLGGLRFNKIQGDLPKDLPMEVSTGFSFQPQWKYLRFLSSIDVRDLTGLGNADRSFSRRLHLGFEMGIWPIDSTSSSLAFRSGYSEGYFTYGLELNPLWISRFINIQIASYAAEMGETPGELKQARKAIQLAFVF